VGGREKKRRIRNIPSALEPEEMEFRELAALPWERIQAGKMLTL
jgi:hypothetical protein